MRHDPYEYDRTDENRERNTRLETYEQKLDRWREDWRRELDEDLEEGR